VHNKIAKPALCFVRIAKAILGDAPLQNSSFLLIKKGKTQALPLYLSVRKYLYTL